VGEPGRAMLNEIQAFTGTGADFDVEYRYDRNGNVVQRRSLRSDGEFVEDFSYDYADRNIDYVKRRNDDPMIVTRETFLPTGERFRVDEQRDGETVSTRFVGSGDNPLVDYTQVDGNELWTSAIHIQGEPEGVLFDPTTGGETLLIRDPIGSVIGSVDETGETGAWSIRTAFGSLLEGPAGAGRFGYAGGELEGSGLIDFRTRTYDPEIGRFLQVDPIDSNRIVNHYLRTAGSPPASPLPVIDTVRFEPPMPIEPMEGTFGPLWGLRADQRFADLP